MSSYKISDHTKTQAKKLGVDVFPSKNKNKKIDVFYNGKKLASVGAVGYKDYTIYLAEDGRKKANERRRLYRIRHAKDLKRRKGGIEKQSPGFFANKLLW